MLAIAEYYREFVAFTLGDRVDPEVLHQTGLRAVTQIEAELRAVAARLGFFDMDTLRKALETDPKLSVPNSDAGYAELQRAVEQRLARVSAKLPQYFAYIPKAPLAVRRALTGPLGGPPGDQVRAEGADSRPRHHRPRLPPVVTGLLP